MDLKRKYYGQCITCNRCNTGRTKGHKLYCTDHNDYYVPFDKCNARMFGGYSENRSITNDDIKYILKKLGYNYYISSAVLNILLSSTTNETEKTLYQDVLETLINFRNVELEDNKDNTSFIDDYETYAELIADKLYEDENSLSLAHHLFNTYLYPCYIFVKTQNYKDATTHYINMCETLQTYYNIENIKTEQRKRTNTNY